MPRPKKQQNITDIFEQFTARLGAMVKEKVLVAVAEATETFFKGGWQGVNPPTKAPAKPEADAAPKTRKRRRRKAAKKAAATTPAPETKPAE